MSPAVRRTRAVLAVFLLTLPLLAACSETASAAPGEVNVILDNFSIKPSPITVTAQAGAVTFHVKNIAKGLTHEFVIIQTDLSADGLPVDGDGNADEEQLKKVDELQDIQPDKSEELKINVAAGHYALICNIKGHYEAGMRAELTVTP